MRLFSLGPISQISRSAENLWLWITQSSLFSPTSLPELNGTLRGYLKVTANLQDPHLSLTKKHEPTQQAVTNQDATKPVSTSHGTGRPSQLTSLCVPIRVWRTFWPSLWLTEKWPPKDAHVRVPRTYECYLTWQKGLWKWDSVPDLEMGRLS